MLHTGYQVAGGGTGSDQRGWKRACLGRVRPARLPARMWAGKESGRESLDNSELYINEPSFQAERPWKNRKRRRLKRSQKLDWVKSRIHKSECSFYPLLQNPCHERKSKVRVWNPHSNMRAVYMGARSAEYLNADWRVTGCKQRAIYVTGEIRHTNVLPLQKKVRSDGQDG